MSTAGLVYAKANPLVVTEQDIVDGSIRGAKMAAEVNRINDARRADAGWRDELGELTRYLSGMPSVDEAEAKLAGLKASVAAAVKEYKGKIADCREALREKFLTPLEQTHVSQRIEVLSGELEDFKRQAEMRLRQAEGRLKDAVEWAPKRERWQELRERARKIDAALRQV